MNENLAYKKGFETGYREAVEDFEIRGKAFGVIVMFISAAITFNAHVSFIVMLIIATVVSLSIVASFFYHRRFYRILVPTFNPISRRHSWHWFWLWFLCFWFCYFLAWQNSISNE